MDHKLGQMQQLSFKDSLIKKTAEWFNIPEEHFSQELYYSREQKNKPLLKVSKSMIASLDNELSQKLFNICPRLKDFSLDKNSNEDNILLSMREALIFVSEIIIKPIYGETYFGDQTAENVKTKDGNFVITDSGFADEIFPLLNISNENSLKDKLKIVHISISSKGFGSETKPENLNFKNDSRDYNLWDIKESIEHYLKNNSDIDNEYFKTNLNKITNILLETKTEREPFKIRKNPIEKDQLKIFLDKVDMLSLYNGLDNLEENLNKLEEITKKYNEKGAKVLFLLNGPAGSGKDFLANNLIDKINDNQHHHIKLEEKIKETLMKSQKDLLPLKIDSKNLSLYLSDKNKKEFIYQDIIYLSSKLQNKYNNHKELNELIEKASMALIMYKKSELLNSFSFSDNKELLTAFLICNLNSNQKQIQTKVSEIFNENFSSLMKSGIIQKLNDRFIEHGDSINSDKLKKDLQNMINFVVDNNIKNIPIKLNMEAIKEYKEILGESSHDLLNNFVQSTKNQQNRQRAQPVYSR